MYVLSHGFLLSLYKAFFNLNTWVCLSCVLTSTGCKCIFIVYAFFLCEASCYKYYLVTYCMLDIADPLRTSLQVSISHPRYHSSWIGILLPFILGYFFIAGRLCINDVSQQCHITGVSLRPLLFHWKYHHIILHLGFFLELSSLVLRNKSHPSFLVGVCMRSFLQVKCISMVRNIS